MRNRVKEDKEGRIYCYCKGWEYRTNLKGQGLWIWKPIDKGWKQIKGTCDFSASDSRSMYQKVYQLGTYIG